MIRIFQPHLNDDDPARYSRLRGVAGMYDVIAFDGDDTLWENEPLYHMTPEPVSGTAGRLWRGGPGG